MSPEIFTPPKEVYLCLRKCPGIDNTTGEIISHPPPPKSAVMSCYIFNEILRIEHLG